jgi:hypothetical protein
MATFGWAKPRPVPILSCHFDSDGNLAVIRGTIRPGVFKLQIPETERAVDSVTLSPEILATGIFVTQRDPEDPAKFYCASLCPSHVHVSGKVIGQISHKAGRKPGPAKGTKPASKQSDSQAA